ncbi:hypothetical protein [Microbacterium sp. A93]|uniref:hypothetical protein n=1 Tax=Microbacterium sp. A93 TaxID=3450716 RepID=UPI003F41C77A
MGDPNQKLSPTDVAEAGLTDWRHSGETLTARFCSRKFATGLDLVNRIGASAQHANHLPPPALMITAGLVQRLLPGDIDSGPVRRRAAQVITAASVGVGLAAGLSFVAHRTTVNPVTPERATALVTTGVNGISRNPMYLSMAGILGAQAIYRASPLAWLPVGIFVIVIDRLQIRPEERALRVLFGEEYEAYCVRVPRWLGAPSWTTSAGRRPMLRSRSDD